MELAQLLNQDRLLHAPGVTDAVSAHLLREAGFEVAYLSGAVTSALALGLPDMGYVHGTDIAALACRVLPALQGIPLIADADTGYGSVLQVRRTVASYATAGIAGLHIEDQVAPKRCGHLAGKAVVERSEALERIGAAVDAASELGTDAPLIIGRTDALSVLGIDEACARARAFSAAGVGAVFVEGVQSRSELEQISAAVDVPLVLNRSEAGRGIAIEDAGLHDLGFRLVIHPVSAMLAAARAVRETYAAIAKDGTAGSVPRESWSALTDLLGLPDILAIDAKAKTQETA